MKKSLFIYIVFCFFISGCNPYLNFADKYYNPKESSGLHLDYSIDLNVNVIPTLYRNEIRKAIERDFCPVFNDCKNLGGDLNLDIKVNNFTYKTPIYGLAWLPLVYVGVPYHPNIATIQLEVVVSDKDEHIVKRYYVNRKYSKWSGLYYGWEYQNYKKEDYVVYKCLAEAMIELKQKLNSDNSLLFTAINKNDEKNLIKKSENSSTSVVSINDNTNEEDSNVDINIPFRGEVFANRFALVIGNEDYSSFQTSLSFESNVNYAINDASVFSQYATRLLGVPEGNVIYLENATAIRMHRAIEKLKLVIKGMKGNAVVFVYYAGHGYPDLETQEPYLIPVDVNTTELEFAIALKDFYKSITEYDAKRVTVIIDACFSGGGRNQGLLAARSVKIVPKAQHLNGNIVVFSASAESQIALPLHNQKHGLFTYYLLKRLKETKGNITYGEFYKHLEQEVTIKSVMQNNREQTPFVNVSVSAQNDWSGWRFYE